MMHNSYALIEKQTIKSMEVSNMKEIFSFKRVTGVVALMLAVVMLFSGCGSKDTASNNSNLGSEDNQTQITSGEENQSTVDGSKDSATNNSSKSSNKNNSKTNSTKKPPLRPTRILKFPAA